MSIPSPVPEGAAPPVSPARPFLNAAALAAVVLLALWLFAYLGGVPLAPAYGLINWHAHEMIFGFGVALLAADLLSTAPAAPGWAVQPLLLLWLAARVAPLFPLLLPPALIALPDLLFLPLLALSVLPALRGVYSRGTLLLQAAVVGLLWGADLLMQLQALGVSAGTATHGTYLALYLLMFHIALSAGRRLPARRDATVLRRWIDILALSGIVALAFAELGEAGRGVYTATAAVAAVANAARLWRCRRENGPGESPWLRYGAYGWSVLVLLLQVAVGWGTLPALPVWHLFTVGALGLYAVALLQRDVDTAGIRHWLWGGLALLLSLAALSRGALPLLLPAGFGTEVAVAGTLWCLAFGLFAVWGFTARHGSGVLDSQRNEERSMQW